MIKYCAKHKIFDKGNGINVTTHDNFIIDGIEINNINRIPYLRLKSISDENEKHLTIRFEDLDLLFNKTSGEFNENYSRIINEKNK